WRPLAAFARLLLPIAMVVGAGGLAAWRGAGLSARERGLLLAGGQSEEHRGVTEQALKALAGAGAEAAQQVPDRADAEAGRQRRLARLKRLDSELVGGTYLTIGLHA